MKLKLKSILRQIKLIILNLGFHPSKGSSLRFYPRFKKERKEWLNQGGKITRDHMILSDYADVAGTARGHYFHQDLLVAKFIHQHNPKRHVDIASRVDGFVAHVASYRVIEVIDVRPLAKSEHKNIKFVQADLMYPQYLEQTDSLSCLHAIEHFGLGRYTDLIDVDGHNKGIANLISLVSKNGRLYISFPIGQNDEVHFNAHRVFHVESIFKHQDIKEKMELVRFDYVDDDGDLHADVNVQNVNTNIKYGCGIYTFIKK
tara:strand:- start:915 stop:1691 length:777 start_codon:yes stop_codon:yes gene_type:complete